jgi:hypothetical protein
MDNLSRPNIVYIMTDQQRYDTLSSVGRTSCRTPNLDRLAEIFNINRWRSLQPGPAPEAYAW